MTRHARQKSRYQPLSRRRAFVVLVTLLAAVAVTAGTYLVISRTGGVATPWIRLGTQDVHSIAFAPASTQQLYFGHHGGVLASSDGGRTWRPLGDARDAMSLRTAEDGSTVIAGHDVFQASTDAGASWHDVPNDLPNTDIHAFARDPGNAARMWAYLATGGVYESTNGGTSWVQRYSGHIPFLTAVRAASSSLLGIDPGSGLASSADGGRTWTAVSDPPTAPVQSLAATTDGRVVLIAGPEGLFRSDDGGRSWTKTGLATSVLAVAIADDARTVVAVSRTSDFYRSEDGGASWPRPRP